jgi:nucleoside phosphorylase
MALTLQDVRGTVEFAIVTVRQDEFDAVLKRLEGREPVRGGKQQYEICRIRATDGVERVVAAVRQLEQGHSAAQAVVADLIADLDPQWVVLTGIAGGVADPDFCLGDVLLASRVHDFSVSAVVDADRVTYQQRGGPVHPEVGKLLGGLEAWRERLGPWNTAESIGQQRPRLRVTAGSLYGGTKYRAKLKKLLLVHFPPNKRPRPPLFHVGPVATSNSLIKQTITVEHWQESARHLTHIEMEAGGAYEAAHRAQRPLLCIRGISDIVGLKRSHEWTSYACHTAASMAFALIKSGAIERLSQQPDEHIVPNALSELIQHSVGPPTPRSASESPGAGTSRNGQSSQISEARDITLVTSRPFWASDAIQMIDIGREFEKVVHHNRVIDRFLDGEKYFLCAAKGMGKTLLLAFKRYLLENGRSKAGLPAVATGVRFVPRGKPYLDVMGDVPTMARESQAAYGAIDNSKRIWGLALRLSALSHVGVSEFELEGLPKSIAEFVRSGRGIAPSEVFQSLATLTVSKINQICDGSQHELERHFRDIRSGVVIFIDRVDQALMSLEKRAWIGLQCGLIEAAWDLMSANSHVKVFATIRQEAYSNYRSATKNNLAGAVTEVAYEQEELFKLLDRLTSWYEDRGSFSDFTGLRKVKNVRGDCEEGAYHYLYRHTIGRRATWCRWPSNSQLPIVSLRSNTGALSVARVPP